MRLKGTTRKVFDEDLARQMHRQGMSSVEIARRFGVGRRRVYRLLVAQPSRSQNAKTAAKK